MRRLERLFEGFLWNSRFITIFAVLASLIASLAMFYVAGLDIAETLRSVAAYATVGHDPQTRDVLRGDIIAGVAEFVEGFLFALVLLIFALGIYELFIRDIGAADASPTSKRAFRVESLDDLKEKLAKVIFLILIVRYFEYALDLPVKSSLDLLYLAVGILLIGVALYLTKPRPRNPDKV